MISNSEFERSILKPLLAIGSRLRAYVLATGCAAVLSFVVIALAVQLLLDYTLRLQRDMRAVLLIVIALAVIVVARKRIWQPWRFRFGPIELAKLIEQQNPHLKSTLVTSVEFVTAGSGNPNSNSPQLAASAVQRAMGDVKPSSFSSVLNHGRARYAFLTVLIVLGISVSAFAAKPEIMGLWFERNILLRDAQWPRQTQLVVELEDGELRGARGDDLELRAMAEGVVPREVEIIFEFESGKTGRENMVRVGQRGFRHTFIRVQEEFRFRLVGGDDATPWYEARLAERPKVESLELRVEPPSYTGIAPFTLPEGQRAVEVLKGSVISITATLNKTASTVTLMAGQERIAACEGVGTTWSATFSPDATRTYQFDIADEMGLRNKRPVRFSIRIAKDAAPRVRLKVAGASDMITPKARLPLEFSISDEFGLADVQLIHRITGPDGDTGSAPVRDFTSGMTKFDVKTIWDVALVSVVPGDQLTLLARATDFDDVSGPNEGQSTELNFRVVTPEELQAELARREHEYRQEFERVIEQQEELRNDLLSLIRQLDDPAITADLANRVVPLERRQRQITGQVNLIRQQFEQVMAEFEINGLDSATVRERLGEGVVDILTEIGKRDLVEAADLLRDVGRKDDAETAAQVADRRQSAVLTKMRQVLNNMLKWEGFHEAVTMLREIVRLQEELNRETAEELERQASDILGPG